MEAILVNFRLSRHRQTNNHMVIRVDGFDSREKAAKLVGKIVSWKSPAGKEIKGKVAAAHGNKGCVRAIFEKGMPGQAVGQKAVVA